MPEHNYHSITDADYQERQKHTTEMKGIQRKTVRELNLPDTVGLQERCCSHLLFPYSSSPGETSQQDHPHQALGINHRDAASVLKPLNVDTLEMPFCQVELKQSGSEFFFLLLWEVNSDAQPSFHQDRAVQGA